MKRPDARGRIALVTTLGLVVGLAGRLATAADGGCPAPDAILARLEMLGLERAARTTRFSEPPPTALYRKAARQIGEVQVDRDGARGIGVVVAPLPIAAVWRAINDEDAQDEGGYLPLNRSEVIGGTPRGTSRRVFQSAERAGMGRWWITRTVMSGDLFRASGGALWEVTWEDEVTDGERKRPPVDDPPDLSPLKTTRGAWLLSALGDRCTFAEHFGWSEPGGFVGFLQGLAYGKALRESIEGIVAMAGSRYASPPDGPPFVKPDGTALEKPSTDPVGHGSQ